MQEFEVPEWVKIKKQDLEIDVTQNYGSGKRERKQVIYDDDLTESQWTKMVEEGKDPQVEMKKKRDEQTWKLSDSTSSDWKRKKS